MTKKAETPRTSLKITVPARDMANEKARSHGMQTLPFVTKLIQNAPWGDK